MPMDALAPLLRCPRCRRELARRDDGFGCTGPDCSRSFATVGSHPVLVDFDHSVLDEASLRARAAASPVPRRGDSGLAGALKGLASPANRVAARQAGTLVAELTRTAGPRRPRLLIAGGGTRGSGTRPLYDSAAIDLIAFDLYASTETQFIADAHQIPLADGSVDAVWVQAVLEHVLEPARVAAEIERVLAPGGWVYAETPFLQHVHEGAWDFTRFTESGHRWLFRNFEKIESGVVAGPGTVWVWATESLVRGLTRSPAAGRLARLLFSWVHAFDGLIPRGHASDGASCVFFLGRRRGAPASPRDAVRGYGGAQR